MSEQAVISPRTARFQRSAAAALAATTALSSPEPAGNLSSSGGLAPGAEDEDGNDFSRQAGEKRVHSDDEDQLSRVVRPRFMPSNPGAWRDLGGLAAAAIKDAQLSAPAIGRVQRYAKAPDDERLFMIFLNSELLLASTKKSAKDWEVPAALKTLCRTRIVACFLSPHIPEYKRNPVKHLTLLIPAASKHMLPDESMSGHKALFKSFISDYATAARNIIKMTIVKSMYRYDADAKKEIVDVTQGWCIGRLCDEIVAKLGTEADIQVTAEVQARIALLRFVYACHPAQAVGPPYWGLVDDTLHKQRQLDAAAMARDVADGLRDDIERYTGSSSETYPLVDVKSIANDSMQALADKAMREYYKVVQPIRKTSGS